MNIKGIQKTSLVDFPGRLSSVIFFYGCNLKCKYCHNPDLVSNNSNLKTYSDVYVLKLLKERASLIDGVVITGGEPTLSKDIDNFIQKIKEIPLKIKIDTNGSNPYVIEKLLNMDLVDYIAIDIKTSPEKYESLTDTYIDFCRINETIKLVKESGIDYELRTTCTPYFVTMDDFKAIKNEVDHVKKYYLQQFVNKITLDPQLKNYVPYTIAVLNEFRDFVKTFADICEIRGI